MPCAWIYRASYIAYASGTATATHLHVSAASLPPRLIFPQVLAPKSLKQLALLPPKRRLRALLKEEEEEDAQEQEKAEEQDEQDEQDEQEKEKKQREEQQEQVQEQAQEEETWERAYC